MAEHFVCDAIDAGHYTETRKDGDYCRKCKTPFPCTIILAARERMRDKLKREARHVLRKLTP